MDRKEKLGTFHLLLDDRFLEADHAFLKKKDPRNKLLEKPINPNLCRQALSELLEIVDREEIIKHRKGFEEEKKKQLAIARRAEQLSQKERLLELIAEGKLKEVRDAVDHLPDDHLFRGDLVKVLKKEEAKAAEIAEKEAVTKSEDIMNLINADKLEDAEEAFDALPQDFMFLTELAESINAAKVAAHEAQVIEDADRAIEEATAEKEVILRLIEEGASEAAQTAIEGLPDDHLFKEELTAAWLNMEKEDPGTGTPNEQTDKDLAAEAKPAAGTTGDEEPATDTAKKKTAPGASSKKS